jgi:hypothetical protein
MKLRHSSTGTTLPLLLVASLLLLSCGLFAPSTGLSATQNGSGAGRTSIAPSSSETALAIGTPTESATTPQPGGFDVSQAGLPPGFPVYPGAHDFSGLPGVMVKSTADVDVGTASEFYDKAMKAIGWSGFSTGGASAGECGGDCGGNATPTSTPGPTPTATPPGWMNQNTQMWTSGTSEIMIMYSANPGGGTDVMITVTAK